MFGRLPIKASFYLRMDTVSPKPLFHWRGGKRNWHGPDGDAETLHFPWHRLLDTIRRGAMLANGPAQSGQPLLAQSVTETSNASPRARLSSGG